MIFKRYVVGTVIILIIIFMIYWYRSEAYVIGKDVYGYPKYSSKYLPSDTLHSLINKNTLPDYIDWYKLHPKTPNRWKTQLPPVMGHFDEAFPSKWTQINDELQVQ